MADIIELAEDARSIIENKFDTTKVNIGKGTLVGNVIDTEILLTQLLLDKMDYMGEQRFLLTATGDNLIKRAEEEGAVRIQPTYATGKLKLTGDTTTIIPSGHKFVDDRGFVYSNTSGRVAMPTGEVYIDIQADKIGAEGNTDANKISSTPIPVIGLKSITNESALTNGRDLEDLEDLRQRALLLAREVEATGNKAYYRKLITANETTVKVASVLSASETSTAGTVTITVISPTGGTVSQSDLDKLNTKYNDDDIKIIGQKVVFVSATVLAITIKLKNAVLSTGYTNDNLKNAVAEKLNEYFIKTANDAKLINYLNVTSIIITLPQLQSVEEILLNDAKDNVVIPIDKLASINNTDVTLIS